MFEEPVAAEDEKLAMFKLDKATSPLVERLNVIDWIHK